MGDYTNKSRPLLERIASLSGKTAWQPIYGLGGSVDALTAQDIAAAVSVARQKDVKNCVRSELLLLHYGGRFDLVYQVARAAWNAICDNIKKEDGNSARMACILAAQALGGRELTQEALKQEAWVIGKNYQALEREVGFAVAWMRGELSEGEAAYKDFLRQREEARPQLRRVNGLR